MEPVSMLVSVCNVAISLKLWLDQRKEKEKTLTDIATTVSSIYNILSPFQAPAVAAQLDHNLLDSIRSIGDALIRTKQHLVAWREKRTERVMAFFTPAAAINQLREDERHLTHQLIITLFSMTVTNFFRGSSTPDNELGSLVLGSITNREVMEFWRDYVGAKVVFIPGDTFCASIKLWSTDTLGEDLSASVCEHLLLCVDEYAIGGITSAGLENFLGSRGLRETILQLKAIGDHAIFPTPSMRPSNYSFDLRLPLIVWVDDNPDNNTAEVAFARNKGITVVELSSTALAKAWIEANYEFLRRNDSPNRIRFISDNARLETNPRAGNFLNISAGENILRYLRGRFFTMPVLVYCGTSIPITEYVLSFAMAGSTTSYAVCTSYISALADGIENDRAWKKYNA